MRKSSVGHWIKSRRLSFWILILLLPLAFDLGFFAAGLLPEPRQPEELAPVDVIVVLTGGQGRLKEAVQFLESGKGKYLFISGTAPQTQLMDILKANKLEGVSSDIQQRILLGDESRSTFENAVEIRKAIETLRAHSILLVTSNYHMKRALWLLNQELNRSPRWSVVVSGYPVDSPNFERSSWWYTPTGWQILISEYLKSWAVVF